MLRSLLLAAPGAGKGTQGERIADRYGVPHLATGDLLRAHVADRTSLGLLAKQHMDAGGLVPDELVNAMVFDRIGGKAPLTGFVLDGFPRTMAQAEAAFEWGRATGNTFHAVVVLEVDDDELVRRLVERGRSSGRSDDTEEVIRNRLRVFEDNTAPLIGFYEQRGILVRIDGYGTVDEVTERICAALDPLVPPTGSVAVSGHDEIVEARLDDGDDNLLGEAEVTALLHALQLAATSSRPLVLTGRTGMFSSGLDPAQLADPDVRPRLVHATRRLLIDLLDAPVPVVVAATGRATGTGAAFLLVADHAVAAPTGAIGFGPVPPGSLLADAAVAMARSRLRPRAVLPACGLGRLVEGDAALIDGWVDEVAAEPYEVAVTRARGLQDRPPTYTDAKQQQWSDVLDLLRGRGRTYQLRPAPFR